jgi:O-antigen ligase
MTTARGADAGKKVDRWLLHGVDAGLGSIVFVLPMLMGGRQALGQLALPVLAATIAAAWCARCALRGASSPHGIRADSPAWNSGCWLLLAGIGLVAFQFVPLPAGWLDVLSPQVARLLPAWSAEGLSSFRPGSWSQISLAPAETRDGLIVLASYGLLFWLACQRIATQADVQRLIGWVAGSAAAMSLLGLAQYLAGNGRFFWVYEHPFVQPLGAVHGAFSNRNHFAQFVAIGIGPLLWWTSQKSSGRGSRGGMSERSFVGVAIRPLVVGLVLFAGCLSLSRGGAVVIGVAAFVAIALLAHAGLFTRRFVLACGAVGVLAVTLLTVHGYETVAARLDDLAAGSVDEVDRFGERRKIWRAVAAATHDFALLGSGAGSHRFIYPLYLPQDSEKEFTHAENGYLQVAEETGLVGLALVLCGMATLATWCLGALRRSKSTSHLACVAAVSASLTASVVHSLVDFVWYVPGCMALVALLAACAWRLSQLATSAASDDETALARRVSRPDASKGRSTPGLRPLAWQLGAALCLLGAVLAVQVQLGAVRAEPYWDRYHRAVRAARADGVKPAVLDYLAAIVQHDPDDARANLSLAEACLREFDHAQQQSDNPMPLVAVRDAAYASQFASLEETHAWLDRALGARKQWLERAAWHSRRATELCPLLGQAYVHLADLSFLHNLDPKTPPACLQQALLVRPHDGGVLFKAGQDALAAGNVPKALEFWRASFRTGPAARAELIEHLASRRAPLEFFFAAELDLDFATLRLLDAAYREQATAGQLAEIRRRYQAAAEDEARKSPNPRAGYYWLQAFQAAVALNDAEAAIRFGRQSLAADPANYDARWCVGSYLLEQKHYEAAEEHLRWCQQRRPTDAQVAASLAAATKGRIDHGAPHTASRHAAQR